MCIVQINNGLGVSCAINISNNIIIYTNNQRVREARESVLEFLLINHPLDCPICDQAGECDLQDLSLVFGTDKGRFYEDKKRSIDNFCQNGPLIKTIMTRCIHCTRCVRFANELSNFSLGVLDRGSNMEIGTYIDISLLDELSGNIIDLCPVGALTSMPYAFKYRPWELSNYSNIDFLDSIGSSIRLHIFSNKIVRILPLLDEYLNEEWISNRTRFSYDALLINRNFYPKIKIYEKFIVFSWDFIINYLFYYINKYIFLNKNIYSFISYYIDIYSSLCLKSFFNSFGCINIIYNKGINWIYDFSNFIFLNSLISELEFIKFYLFICCNLRLEAPLLNLRIKKNYNLNKINNIIIYSYGLPLSYFTFPIKNLGNILNKFYLMLEWKHRFLSEFFFKSFLTLSFINFNYYIFNKPIFFIGNSVILRNDSINLFLSILYFIQNKFKLSCINLINSYMGFYSFSNIIYNKINFNLSFKGFLYNLTGDSLINFDIDNSFMVYQGFINNYNNNDIILPIAGPYEVDLLYFNLEGRYRLMKQSIKSFIGLYANWEVISLLNLYNKKKKKLKFYNFNKFIEIIKFFKLFLNYFCNFFLIIDKFFLEFFFFTGFYNIKNFNKKNIIYILYFFL